MRQETKHCWLRRLMASSFAIDIRATLAKAACAHKRPNSTILQVKRARELHGTRSPAQVGRIAATERGDGPYKLVWLKVLDVCQRGAQSESFRDRKSSSGLVRVPADRARTALKLKLPSASCCSYLPCRWES